MLVATLVFLLIVIAYTGWVFRVMRASVTAAALSRKSKSARENGGETRTEL
jgi:cytochrome bd-type quinol oxidase subunit 2